MLALLAVLAAPAADRVATLHLGIGVPDLLGGGVSLTAFRPFELEVGAATGILYDTAYARAGVALPVADGRGDDGRGGLLEGLVLGGWRGLRGQPWTGDARRHGAELDLALEGSWWLDRRFALDAQVLAGGGLWLTGEADGGVAPFLDGRLSVGVAF